MQKIVKAYGGAVVVTFTAEERKIYGFKVGDILDIEMVKVEPYYGAET